MTSQEQELLTRVARAIRDKIDRHMDTEDMARAAFEAIGPELRACIAYFDGYAQDEADDEENCVAGTYQHASAQAFRDAVTGFRASLSKGEE